MKHLVKYATMMCMVLAMGLTFTSCGDDDDPISEFGDFYLKFELVDKGSFTSAEANQVIGELNAEVATMEATSKAEAEYYYNRMITSLKNSFSGDNGYTFSFRIKLMQDGKTVKSNVFYIKMYGCDVD